jgi:hypothetical protein
MENLTAQYLFRAEAWMLITILIYFIMNGAGIFETSVIIPKWSASPPESFQILRGKYGIDLKVFWIVMHSIHELTFIVAIVFCWQIDGVREWLLLMFGVHFGVRIWTLAYFAPNIIEFQRIANRGGNTAGLEQRVRRWRNLNYARTFTFVAVSLGMVATFVELLRGQY